MATSSGSAVPLQLPVRNYVRIKVVSLGEAGSGKSCLIKRYCEKKFIPKYISTIGVDFGVRQVSWTGDTGGAPSSIDLKVNFFDLAGDPNLFEVRREFHAHAQGVMLVYDVTDRTSFTALPRWVAEHASHGGQPAVTVLCANKVDEPASARVISEADGRRYAKDNGFVYMETSAKSGQNVDALFAALFKGIQEKAPKIG
jgi:DnaJ family protein C protein 27